MTQNKNLIGRLTKNMHAARAARPSEQFPAKRQRQIVMFSCFHSLHDNLNKQLLDKTSNSLYLIQW